MFQKKKEKKRKTPGDINNTLHLCTLNIKDMIYSSWYIEHDRLKLVILGHFLPFYPLKTQKSEFWKNEKIAGDIIVLHMCTKNHSRMRYNSWDTKLEGKNL